MTALHTRIMATDIKAINTTLSEYGIEAGIPARTQAEARRHSLIALSSHCAYYARFSGGEKFSRLEAITRELAVAVATARVRAGFKARKISLRFQPEPFPMLEIDSPVIRILELPSQVELPAWQGALGRSYGHHGMREEVIDLAQHYQTLIAAMSGHGKSVVLRSVLATMLNNTGPDQLRAIFIDLKNDDLVPFRDAPHVLRYAGSIDEAVEAIRLATAIKQERIDSLVPWPWRLLVVVDEIAMLNDGKNEERPGAVRYEASEIMNVGRSLGIHFLMATQHPSGKYLGARIPRAFTHRIVGRVDNSQSARFVAGQSDTGAEQLKKKGSFLIVADGVQRVQTYFSTIDESTRRVAAIHRKWGGATAPIDLVSTTDPILQRDEIDDLADQIEIFLAGQDGNVSKNQISLAVTDKPFAGTSHTARINAALQRIEERQASSTTTTLKLA